MSGDISIIRNINMPKKISLSQNQIDTICSLYSSGLSSIKVGEICKLSSFYIRKIIKENGHIRLYNEKISDEIINKLCLLYIDGYSATKLSSIYDIDESTIVNYLRKNNIEIRTLTHWKSPKLNDEKTRIYIIGNYIDDPNKKINDISKEMNISSQTISKFLKSKNIPIKKLGSRKWFFNKDFFSAETWQTAYFYGFCLGDGCIYRNKQFARIQINLHKKDRLILEEFCIWMNLSNKAIIDNTKNNHVSLFLTNEIFRYDYSKFGLVKNKTYEGIAPSDFDIDFLIPFIIGLIDADGTIRVNNKKNKYTRFSLTCGKNIIKWYISSLRRIGFVGYIKEEYPIGKSWGRAHIYHHNDICTLISLLNYKNYFYLNRKWDQLVL